MTRRPLSARAVARAKPAVTVRSPEPGPEFDCTPRSAAQHPAQPPGWRSGRLGTARADTLRSVRAAGRPRRRRQTRPESGRRAPAGRLGPRRALASARPPPHSPPRRCPRTPGRGGCAGRPPRPAARRGAPEAWPAGAPTPPAAPSPPAPCPPDPLAVAAGRRPPTAGSPARAGCPPGRCPAAPGRAPSESGRPVRRSRSGPARRSGPTRRSRPARPRREWWRADRPGPRGRQLRATPADGVPADPGSRRVPAGRAAAAGRRAVRSPITRAGSPAVQGGEECPVRRIVGPGRETGRVSRFRLSPTLAQETALLGHCAQARFVWNLALEQANYYGTAGRKAPPNFAAQCRQLTEARAEHQWLAAGSQTVQQQARRDLDQAWRNFYGRTHRRPTRRKAGRHGGFRIVGGPAGRSAGSTVAGPRSQCRRSAGSGAGSAGPSPTPSPTG